MNKTNIKTLQQRLSKIIFIQSAKRNDTLLLLIGTINETLKTTNIENKTNYEIILNIQNIYKNLINEYKFYKLKQDTIKILQDNINYLETFINKYKLHFN